MIYQAEITMQFSKGGIGSRVIEDSSKLNLESRISQILESVISFSRTTDNHVVAHKISMRELRQLEETF